MIVAGSKRWETSIVPWYYQMASLHCLRIGCTLALQMSLLCIRLHNCVLLWALSLSTCPYRFSRVAVASQTPFIPTGWECSNRKNCQARYPRKTWDMQSTLLGLCTKTSFQLISIWKSCSLAKVATRGSVLSILSSMEEYSFWQQRMATWCSCFWVNN